MQEYKIQEGSVDSRTYKHEAHSIYFERTIIRSNLHIYIHTHTSTSKKFYKGQFLLSDPSDCIQYQVQAQLKLAGTAMNYPSSYFEGWKTSSPKNHFKVILQQMGELLELRARSGTAEKIFDSAYCSWWMQKAMSQEPVPTFSQTFN